MDDDLFEEMVGADADLRDVLAAALRERDEARVALDAANAALANATNDLGAAQDEIDALRADLKRHTDVYGDPDAPVDVAHLFTPEKPDPRPLTGSFPWGRDKVEALLRTHRALAWTVTGDAGERVLRATQGVYSARIVEGRVWRWQVGTESCPAFYGGRIVGTLEDAQAACTHALSLCMFDEKSDVPGGVR